MGAAKKSFLPRVVYHLAEVENRPSTQRHDLLRAYPKTLLELR
jgi:hypothetical protein